MQPSATEAPELRTCSTDSQDGLALPAPLTLAGDGFDIRSIRARLRLVLVVTHILGAIQMANRDTTQMRGS